jgi:DNA-binding PadR family transcriptional regulator
MEEEWTEQETSIDTVNWKGEPIHLTRVKALKSTKTGEVRIFPFDLVKAEFNQMADCLKITPDDIGTLTVILAKPGYFRGGEVLYKYHLQKIMFYLWKSIEANGYENTLPLDKFKAAKNGPVPEHLDQDLQRLEEKGLIKVQSEQTEYGKSKRITLTKEGIKVADAIWNDFPDPFREIAIKVKERIYPLSPDRVRQLVHNEYPEYKNTYVENDIE